jgi:hypothetical protein
LFSTRLLFLVFVASLTAGYNLFSGHHEGCPVSFAQKVFGYAARRCRRHVNAMRLAAPMAMRMRVDGLGSPMKKPPPSKSP